jgi:very-short-patch-repair endonuclease
MANKHARDLRKKLTSQEVKLWVKLRELRSLGFHFRRQSPILKYIVDFECRKTRLVVEVDGGQHNLDPHIRTDAERDSVLKNHRYRVLRFWNHEVDRNLEGVMSTIMTALNNARTPPAASRREAPPSPFGEG